MTAPPPGSAPVITVILVDPHVQLRAALAATLSAERDISVVATVGGYDEALAAVRLRRPRVALVDVAALGHHGMGGIAELRAVAPRIAVVVMGMVEDRALDRDAVRHGAVRRVLKDAASADLLTAVRAAARRQTRLRIVRGAE